MTAVVAPIATIVTDPNRSSGVRSVGRHRVSRRSAVARIGSAISTLVLSVGIAALLFMTVAPRILHYHTATMLTGSMVPTINPGDVIVDTQEPADDIAVGQIISYHIPVEDHRVESHRVVWVGRAKNGNVEFRTKGDANTAPDPWTAQVTTPDVWRVRAVLPVVGSVIRFLRAPAEHMLLAILLPVALILMTLWTIWKPSSDTSGKPDGDVPADDAPADEASARK